MSRYTGRTMLEVDAPADMIEGIASDFQAALKFASTGFSSVHDVAVVSHPESFMITVTMILEADGAEELDDVADELLERALDMLEEPDESDELTVVESALVPA